MRTRVWSSVVILWLLLLVLSTIVPAAEDESQEPVPASRLVVLNWGFLETLIAMGHPPAAAANLSGYRTWVSEPAVPESVVDVGLRNQPSLELLADVAPDRILLAPHIASVKPQLDRIAPTTVMRLFSPDGDLWPKLVSLTRDMAAWTGAPSAGDRLVRRVEARLAELKQRLPDDVPPLLVVQFMDDRHVRVFGDHGLFAATLERMGLRSGWRGKTNYWGFSMVGVEALARAANLSDETPRLVVVRPMPPGVRASLKTSGLWQSLPSVTEYDPIFLSPVWSFGALPSAQRFAGLIAAALTAPDQKEQSDE
ncbi:iron-siderophore ABC transporter substrate-binding protein [Tamilnaduibacter salinus]|nr:iron-siderophore ABC transporter substrate-binding protein [Tamilnaduibacter salinus]